MTTHATRLQRLEAEQRKRMPAEEQHVFAHGPGAEGSPGYSHSAAMEAIRWNSQFYVPPGGEGRAKWPQIGR